MNLSERQPTRLIQRIEDGISELDSLLASSDVYTLPPEVSGTTRLAAITESVGIHCMVNEEFAAYCERVGFSTDCLGSVDALSQVPLLPSALFKREAHIVRSSADPAGCVTTTSSGTKGTLSVVLRDDLTLMRFFASIAIGTRELMDIESSDMLLFNLGPAQEEARALWIAYVMAGVAVLYGGESYTRDGVFRVSEIVHDILAAEGRQVTLVGPPPLLLELARTLANEGVTPSLREDSVVIAIGGWKRREGEIVPRTDFDKEVACALGIGEDRVRDAYNMVEMNTVIFECEYKHKHCPPWLYVEAKDPRTLYPMPSKAPGILAFLDATPTSFPGFVLSDDFGYVQRRFKCPCTRTTDVVVVERRINRVESRGCAMKMDTRASI